MNVEKRSLYTHVLFSPGERRLRAGWRILAQTLLAIAIWLLGSALFKAVASLSGPFGPAAIVPSGFPLLLFLQCLVMTVSVFLARLWFDRRSIPSLGLAFNRWTAVDLVFGVLLMGMAYALIYLTMERAGWLHPNPVDWSGITLANIASALLMGFIWSVFASWGEELMFRGYWLQNISEGLNLFWAAVIPSTLFGILHLTSPEATVASAVGVAAGAFLLTIACLRTRQLWLPIGIHIGNNFVQGSIFGFSVSGVEKLSLLQPDITGPEAITGGAFGPEAGLIVLPFMLLMAVVIYFYTRGRVESSSPTRPASLARLSLRHQQVHDEGSAQS
jgi:membrane protease YdiL (CAAX protease family)